MKTKTIKINEWAYPIQKKYLDFANKKIQVFDQVDNKGDYTITSESNEYPFVFIPFNICNDLTL